MLLLGQAALLRGASRFGGPAFLGDDERVPDQGRQPIFGRDTVLLLTSPVARHDTDFALGVKAWCKLGPESLPLLVVDRQRVVQVPEQLDPCGRGVDVLAASSTGSCRPKRELGAWDRQPRTHGQV